MESLMANLRVALHEVTSLVPRISVVYRAIGELTLDPANPRRHRKKQIRRLAESIKVFGFIVPIMIDRSGKVIAGHGRVLAARELGMTEVPTVCLDHLTPAQARAFMIADNRLGEIASWDDRLLAQHLKDLSLLGLDFSLEVTGFELGEIDLRIASLEDTSDRANDPGDVVPEVLLSPPVSKLSDLWLLGRHRVLCGSPLYPEAFTALMVEERAAMVFTNPSGLGAVHHRPFPMTLDELDRAEFTAFLSQVFQNLAAFSADGALHFISMDWRRLDELLAAGRGTYGELQNLCVWVKDNSAMGSLYRDQHELVFIFKHGRHGERDNLRPGRKRSNVWHYPGTGSFARRRGQGSLQTPHPSVKPVAMVADAIRDGSVRGDIVLDAFLGSGTTLIAAERIGRRCYGMELDPLLVDTIVRHWQTRTGGSARHAIGDRSFDQVACEAEAANAV
jgi:ParB-like chromosome segregation protein Spo0J